jgi:hypothetical protein
LHLSQIGFTDARTFIGSSLLYCLVVVNLRLLVAVDDAAAIQVVGAKLDGDTITGEDADEVLSHAT